MVMGIKIPWSPKKKVVPFAPNNNIFLRANGVGERETETERETERKRTVKKREGKGRRRRKGALGDRRDEEKGKQKEL